MALGFTNNGNSGNFTPIIIWNAKSGRMELNDRAQDHHGKWETERTDVGELKPTFAMDFASIETGYQAFLPTGPDFKMAPFGQPMPPRPSADHKHGMSVKLFEAGLFGGVRLWSASAKSVLGVIDRLHDEFLAAPEAAKGMIPLVKLDGAQAVVTTGPNGKVTSYAPKLRIVGWTPRDTALGEATASVPAPTTPAARGQDGATQAAPGKDILDRIRQKTMAQAPAPTMSQAAAQEFRA